MQEGIEHHHQLSAQAKDLPASDTMVQPGVESLGKTMKRESDGRRKFARGALGFAALPLAGVSSEALAAGASTEAVLKHHLGAFAKGLDELMKDYTASSVILTHDKQYAGLVEIRVFFDGFLKSVKPGFWEAFKITAQAIDRDVAYIVWEAKPFVNLATDTLVVRGGKIAVQTFTAG